MTKYYDVFHRTWWRMENGIKVPGIGKRHWIQKHVTEADAIELCQEYNSTHKPGKLSDRAEFEESE